MIPLPVSELDGLGAVDASAREVTGVRVDSRLVEPGDLFVAVGRGADYLPDARARGAVATLVPDDAFAAMAAIGRSIRDRTGARVVGITGSTGKTSTKDILAALCRAAGTRTVAAEASFNNEIGVPLTLCRLEPDTQVCIVELAMRGLGQIAELATVARPEIGVITNVGPVHLELVGTLENVVRAKGELVEALPAGGTAIVPDDFAVARDDLAVVRVGDPDTEPDGGRTRVGGVSFNFVARHQARNAAAALAALDALGLDRPDRVDVEFSRWRGEESPLPGGGLVINDAYNANPVSMRAALDYLVERAAGRRAVAVLGEMAELGRTGPGYHREVGEAAAAAGIDEILAVGELARAYLAGGVRGRWVPNVHEALRELDEVVRPGDAVLVKASRAIGLELVAEALAGVAA